MNLPCQSPLPWDTLLDYWCGDLDTGSEEQIEEHYLGCAHCSRRLEQLKDLAQGVRSLARSSGATMIVNEAFVRRLARDGRHLREYRVPLNGSVNCTVTADDDFLVSYLEAPLAGVQRIDMLTLDNDGRILLRQDDIPFDADSGSVIFLPGIEAIRALPKTTMHLRLLAVDELGDHVLGDYRFHHTPQRP